MLRDITLDHDLFFTFLDYPRTPIEIAEALFYDYLPLNTNLEIEADNCCGKLRYILRLNYTSAKSGRHICVTAKGDELPTSDGSLLQFYIRQIVLTPLQAAQEFNRVAFLEKRARQGAFLNNQSGNILVTDKVAAKDLLRFDDYRDTLPSLKEQS